MMVTQLCTSAHLVETATVGNFNQLVKVAKKTPIKFLVDLLKHITHVSQYNKETWLCSDEVSDKEAWRKRKHELAQLVAARESDMRVVEALKKRYSFEEWYK
jgi:hypothetical protein